MYLEMALFHQQSLVGNFSPIIIGFIFTQQDGNFFHGTPKIGGHIFATNFWGKPIGMMTRWRSGGICYGDCSFQT